MKDLIFLGDSRKRLKAFAEIARKDLGHGLRDVQQGEEPADWKPMPGMPQGVRELRVKNEAGAFRALYVIEDQIVVLNVFHKKSQAAPKLELDLARARLKAWENQK